MDALHTQIHEVKLEIVEARKDIASLAATILLSNAGIEENRRWRDGDNDTPGVKVRLDRIERFNAVMIWVAGLLATAITGSAAYAIFGN